MGQDIQSFLRAYRHDFRATLILSFPVVVGQLGNVLMGFIDNLMIGQLGYVYLSAATLANGSFFTIIVLGVGICLAISPLVAEAEGANDVIRVGSFLRQGIWVALAAGLLLGSLIYLTGLILPYLDQPPEEIPIAQSYISIISWSAIPMMLFLTFKQFADGLSLTRPAMYITLLGLGFNVFINWLLIFGNWGFPRLELDGAGYGTFCSRMFMLVLMVSYVLKSKHFKKYDIRFRINEFRLRVIRKILSIGFPSGLQYFFEVGAFVGAAVMIGLMENGSANRAAHQIAIQLAAITYMIVSGIAAGATIRVGKALGQKNRVGVRKAGMAGVYLGAIFMLISALIMLLGRKIIPTYFVSDLEVQRLAAQLIIWGAAFQLFDGVQAVAVGILRGIQDVNIPTWITLIAYWGIALPIGIVLVFYVKTGVVGIWYGFVISLVFAAVMLTGRFLLLTRSKDQLRIS